MTKQNPFSRWWLGLAAVLLAGVVFWYFRAGPVVPPTAPVAHAPLAPTATPVAAPENLPTPEPVGESAAVSAPAQSGPAVAPVPAPLVAAPVSQSPLSVPEAAKPGVAADSVALAASAQKKTDEVAATARMYAAHSSLRTPEVADPDSPTNRQILQTMVLKALAQPATPAPAK